MQISRNQGRYQLCSPMLRWGNRWQGHRLLTLMSEKKLRFIWSSEIIEMSFCQHQYCPDYTKSVICIMRATSPSQDKDISSSPIQTTRWSKPPGVRSFWRALRSLWWSIRLEWPNSISFWAVQIRITITRLAVVGQILQRITNASFK